MLIRSLLIVMLVIAAFSGFGQSPLAQTVDVTFEKISLDSALLQLLNEAGINISYSNDLLPSDRRYERMFESTPVIEILDFLLHETGLAYSLVGKQIVLYKIEPQIRFYTVSGLVEDRVSGEKLIGANVYDPITFRGAITNAYGFYSLLLPEGPTKIIVSYLGYRTESRVVELNRNVQLDVTLEQDAQLALVIVTDSSFTSGSQGDGSFQNLNLQELKQLPSLAGEPDLVRYSALQPGVLTGTDGFGGVHVRGGNADQNLFLLDGVPVYSPSHGAGMFSIFNSQAIRSARMFKGGFPARYGGRLSSVYDIRMKEGNNRQFAGEAGISLIAAKVAIEGPIDPEVSSFFLSARRTTMDPWLRGMTRYVNQERGNQGFSDFHFYDVHGKLNFRSGRDHRFYISLYHGDDKFHQEKRRSVRFTSESRSDQSQSDLQWGNTVASFRWNWLLHPKWFLNTTIYTSSFKFDLLDYYEFIQEDEQSTRKEFDLLAFSSLIQDTGMRIEGEYHPGNGHTLRFGGGIVRHRFQPGVMAFDENSVEGEITVVDGEIRNLDSLPIYQVLPSVETEMYLEDEWQLHPDWQLNTGLYANYFTGAERNYLSLQPRVQLHWRPIPQVNTRISYGHMAQNLHLLTNSGLGLPSDLWVPVSGNIKPIEARQVEIGMEVMAGKNISIEIGAYYKSMDHLLAWRPNAIFLVNGNILQGGVSTDYWESLVTTGKGTSKGLEVKILGETSFLRAGVMYSLARTEHSFSEINNGKSFPFRYDRTHTLHVTQQWQLNEHLQANVLWTYATGNPMTIPQGQYSVHSLYFISPGIDYSERNAFRIKDYHRLDITLQYTLVQKRYRHILDIGIYNVYNRLNPLFIRARENIYNRDQRDLVEVSLLPVLPVISYQIRLE